MTLTQVQTFLEMDSHEEKSKKSLSVTKELEATEERKRRAKEIQRKEMARKTMDQLHLGAGAGVGTSSFGYDSYQNNHQPTYQPTPVVETTHSAGSTPQALLLTLCYPNQEVVDCNWEVKDYCW